MTDTRQEPTFHPYSRATAQTRARRRRRSATPMLVALLALACIAAGWFWLSRSQAPTRIAAPAASTSADGAAQPESPSTPAPPRPALLPAPAETLVDAEDVNGALVQFLGRDTVLKFLETTDFPRRFVATLDNLGRDHAPVTSWPVLPTAGRFVAAMEGTSQVIAAENAIRYVPFVAFANSVDAAQAVELYRRMYPLLQQAYRDLGFGDRSLHHRMFEVIDLLLATPEPAQSPRITLTEVKGPVPSSQPWTRYEYADAGLERLAAGQKMLLRMGPDNRNVLKAKLRELRAQLLRVSAEPSRQ